MALIQDVKSICDRLAGKGWRDLFLTVTNGEFDLSQTSAPRLRTALAAPLASIDRSITGFEDFHPTANQAVTGGKPSHSLLYHAFASPSVHPPANGEPSGRQSDYPTLQELDTFENYIYSLVADRTDLNDTFIAVFSYQYRVAKRTTHQRHADLTFSRTGVARVGTANSNYDASRRSFWVTPSSGGDEISVLPSRFGAFLARRARRGTAGSVMGTRSSNGGPDLDEYIFPVHKLFSGTECLGGRNLDVSFLEFHRNEKLRKTHSVPTFRGGLPLPAGFDTSKSPYVRDSTNGGKLVSLKAAGDSTLVVPRPGKTLIRTVSQRNSVSNTRQIVHFVVPASRRIVTSTLMIPPSNGDRLAPEYVNIRQKVEPNGPVEQTPEDLNELSDTAFRNAMANGGHEAAHFVDDSCDGCVEAVVSGLPEETENIPAFSLVTAPDFFPLADQSEVQSDPSINLTAPLSQGRLPANPSLPRPSDLSRFSFQHSDRTVTAIVGAPTVGTMMSSINPVNRMVSYLPDAASNVFAPGWDTSRSRDALGTFLTSSGLGSPFPEDAKLCAAIASFWPAVAPDNGRTFGNDESPEININLGNQLPMLDEELGFHPNHERVQNNEVTSYRGWDGEFGPFFERVSNKLHVNYVAIERSDYIVQSLKGRVRVSLTSEVQSQDLINRHQALRKTESVLDTPSGAIVCLVIFRQIENWTVFGSGDPQLLGQGFLFEFAELRGNRKATSEKVRVRKEVAKRHICQFGSNGIAYKQGNAAFTFIPH